MTTYDALLSVRKEVDARWRYHRYGFGRGFESEQTAEEALKDLLETIDRIVGKTIVESNLSINKAPRGVIYCAVQYAKELAERVSFAPSSKAG